MGSAAKKKKQPHSQVFTENKPVLLIYKVRIFPLILHMAACVTILIWEKPLHSNHQTTNWIVILSNFNNFFLGNND